MPIKNEQGDTVPFVLERQPYDTLAQLAQDLEAGKVFTQNHIRVTDEELLGSIFFPIGLGAFVELTEEECNSIGLVYQYLDKAEERGINGYPTFFSMKMLGTEDAEAVMQLRYAIRNAVSEAIDFEKSVAKAEEFRKGRAK